MRVLLTRPLQQAEKMTVQVRAQGWEPIVAPLLEIRPVNWRPDLLLNAQAVLLSSRNAAVRLTEAVRPSFSPRIYCVGAATAEPLLEARFNRVYTADGTAYGLASMISRDLDPAAGRLVYLSADVVSKDLGLLLKPAGFDVRRVICYEAQRVPALPTAAVSALKSGTLTAAMFLSVRTAHVFVSLVQAARLEHTCCAIQAITLSRSIMQALTPLRFAATKVARQPSRKSLLDTLGSAARFV